MAKKVFFSGAGLVTPIGHDIKSTISNIQKKNAFPTRLHLSNKNQEFDIPYHTIAKPNIKSGPSRQHSLIDTVIHNALKSANLRTNDLSSMGIFLGSTSFDIFSAENQIKKTPKEDADILKNIPQYQVISEYITDKYSIKGPSYTFNTACSSAANALMYAAEFIRRGELEHALVLGVEFYNETTARGFLGLELISKNGMQPFSPHRDGLILGEACGAIILSRKQAHHNFGIVSAANFADNHSLTACNPDGSSIESVITAALEEAEIAPKSIRLVKAHGTASLSNDEAEAAGLQRVFSSPPPITCIKPYIGHTLGACGIVELIIFYHSLLAQKVISPLNKVEIDKAFHVTFTPSSYTFDPGYFLLNSFGFGGNNTALIISNK